MKLKLNTDAYQLGLHCLCHIPYLGISFYLLDLLMKINLEFKLELFGN